MPDKPEGLRSDIAQLLAECEQDVARLRDKGWTAADFSQALKRYFETGEATPEPDYPAIPGERVQRCIEAHLQKARDYEQGGNTRGAMQARAAANLLDALRKGDNWHTVVH